VFIINTNGKWFSGQIRHKSLRNSNNQ
jgi:hypothetical protein